MHRHLLAVALVAAAGFSLSSAGPVLANDQLRAQVTEQVRLLGMSPRILEGASTQQVASILLVTNDASDPVSRKAERIRVILGR